MAEKNPNPSSFADKARKIKGKTKEALKNEFQGDEVKSEAKKEEFDAKDWEKIEDLAYFIFKHRMAGDDKKAREWQRKMAKEYGEDEKAFQKETIDALLPKGIEKWSPEAEEYMRKWDWGKAIEIYRRKKDEWQGKKTVAEKPAAETAAAAPLPGAPAPETATVKPEAVGPPAAEMPKSAETGPAATGPAQRVERSEADPLAEAEKKLKEAKESYERAFGKAFTDRKWYQRILGVNIEKSEDVQLASKNYQKALGEFIKTKESDILAKLRSGQITAQEAEVESKNFANIIKADQVASLAQGKQREAERQGEEKGLIITKLSARWNEMIGKWRKLPLPVKAALSMGAFFAGGAGAVVAVGFIRVLNGAVFGKAAQEYLQGLAEAGRKDKDKAILRQVGKEIESKIGDAEDRVKRVFGILERDTVGISEKLTKQAGGDIWRRRVGILAGVIAGSGLMAKAIGWGVGKFWATPPAEIPSGKGALTPLEGSGESAVGIPEKMPFTGHGHVINQGENIWKVTRDIYMENPKGYGYSPDDPKIGRLFRSFKSQGILDKMGIDADNLSDLSDGEKLKIWAENKTANSIAKSKNIFNLVHAGDTVTVKPDGTIVFDNVSGFKASYLHDVQRPRGSGGGTYEPQGKGAAAYEPGGKKVIDISEYDKQIEEARGRGLAADARLREIRGPIAAQLAEEAELNKAVDVARTEDLMDFIQSKIYGPGTKIDWQSPARLFREKMLGQFVTFDQPMGPPANVFDQQQNWQAAQIINNKLGPTIGNESTQDWLTRGIRENRVSPEEVIRTLNQVVNG
ncbi:MAG: hypothetical protein QMD77_03335 [Patescibacteria group bacterium]|nr:hypothetical protein [Patescibacteria group bacterium]